MRCLNIKNVPDEIHEGLKQMAHVHRRSLNGQVLVILQEALAAAPRSRADADDILARTNALAARMRGQLTRRQIHDAINRGRP